MILHLYWLVLLGVSVTVPRYYIYKLNPKEPKKLLKWKNEMTGCIKWTVIISAGGFIIFSIIAILHVVFGYSFYESFRYYSEDDGEMKSFFFTYRSMFFVAVTSYIFYLFHGGSFFKIFSGKFIDEETND